MPTFTITKVLIVNDEGQLLLIRRSRSDDRRPGQWDMPGGRVEDGEDLTAAVIRETEEEVGVRLDWPRVIYGYSEPRLPDGYPTWIFFVDHIGEPPQIKLSFEHDEHRWFSPADALVNIRYALHEQVLRYAIDNHLLDPFEPTA